MHPILITMPTLGIRILTGPTLVLLALPVGVWLASRLAETLESLERRAVRRACVVLAIVALIGGRLYFVVNHWGLYREHPLTVLALWSGGRHAAGAMLLVTLAAPLVCRWYRLPFRRLADSGGIGLAVGLAISRLGCFFHGCCFGTVCDWPWCVGFPPSAPIYNLQAPLGLLPPGATRSLPVHPLQLYFAGAALLVAVVARWHQPRRRFPGEVMLVSLVLFSASSAALELLRYDYVGRPYWGRFPQLLMTASAMTAGALLVLIGAEAIHALRYRRQGRRAWSAFGPFTRAGAAPGRAS